MDKTPPRRRPKSHDHLEADSECAAAQSPKISTPEAALALSPNPRKRKALAASSKQIPLSDVVLTDFDLASRQAPRGGVDETPVSRRHVRRRLARTDTNQDPEFETLSMLNKRFIRDSEGGGSLLVAGATFKETHVKFINLNEKPVGYLAMKAFDHSVLTNVPGLPQVVCALADKAPMVLPVLQHLYVEPEFRRQGVAHVAMRQALRNTRHMVAEVPVPRHTRPATMCLLEKLGWSLVGVRQLPEATALVRYVRA